MNGWDHAAVAGRLAGILRIAARRHRHTAAQLDKLADAVAAGEAAEIEQRLAPFTGFERLGVGHDVAQAVDIIRFLWPPVPEPEEPEGES